MVALRLREILGLVGVYNIAIVGLGRLGQAITDYPAIGEYGFALKAMFDQDPSKVGRAFSGVEVSHIDTMPRVIAELDIDMALITVPVEAAQGVADSLVNAGIRAILNFAPVVLNVPEHVTVESVDFLAGLKRLSYHLRGKPVLRHGVRQQAL
jgi:redox-sensing transcriptional repressor